MDIYQSYISKSRYARYLSDKKRREHQTETVSRYIEFMKTKVLLPASTWAVLEDAIVNFDVMPSMRALMTAGKALDRDNTAGYNCSYLPVDDPKSFDEAMFILMCFHPDTKIKTKDGSKSISQIEIDDEVLSFNEKSHEFEWKKVFSTVQTPTKMSEKYRITLENDKYFDCTGNHEWLTENRGWVRADALTIEDSLVSPKFELYSVTNTITGKKYIGYTSKSSQIRFQQHLAEARKNCPGHFKNALRKYSKENWILETIDFAYTLDEAHRKEIELIAIFDTKTNGYNSNTGGQGTVGIKWSENSKENAKKNAYVRTKEHRDKQREVMKRNFAKINETRKTQEYKEAQRIRNLGERNPMFGKKDSEERLIQKRIVASTRNRNEMGRFV